MMAASESSGACPSFEKVCMTPQQLLGLGLRIASVWIFLLAFQLLTLAELTFSVTAEKISPLWVAISLLPCIPAIFLWFFPMLVAHKLVPCQQAMGKVETIRDVTAALAVIIGVFAVVKAAPHVFSGICMTIIGAESEMFAGYFESGFGTQFRAAIAQYFLGFILIFLPRFVAGLIFHDRSAAASALKLQEPTES